MQPLSFKAAPSISHQWAESYAEFRRTDQATIDDDLTDLWAQTSRRESNFVPSPFAAFGNPVPITWTRHQRLRVGVGGVRIPKRLSPAEIAAQGPCDGWDPILPSLAEFREEAPISDPSLFSHRSHASLTNIGQPDSFSSSRTCVSTGESASSLVQSFSSFDSSTTLAEASEFGTSFELKWPAPPAFSQRPSLKSSCRLHQRKSVSAIRVRFSVKVLSKRLKAFSLRSHKNGSESVSAPPPPLEQACSTEVGEVALDETIVTVGEESQEVIPEVMGADIVSFLSVVFADQSQYRRFLSLRGERAQKVVDLLQALLVQSSPSLVQRSSILAAMQRLSKAADVHPAHLKLEAESVTWSISDFVTSGTFGDIYRGQCKDKAVCVKVIRPIQIEGEQLKQLGKKFAYEAILWGQLNHPNVLPFLGSYLSSARPCLVSPWMANGDVNSYLKRNPSSNRYVLARDILNGLDYLHSWNIIHGDLKGVNVLIDDVGVALLADFGISSVYDESIPHWTTHSTVASTGGTRRWQAPELFDFRVNDKEVYNTRETDVYAWSCVCYELFTGLPPFHETRYNEAVVFRILQDKAIPSRPPNLSPAWEEWGLTEVFWDLMVRCWAREPASRPKVPDLLLVLSHLGPVEGSRSRGTGHGMVMTIGSMVLWDTLPTLQDLSDWLDTV